MMQHLITIFLSCVLLSHTVEASTATEPDPEASRIIEEFGLSESEAPAASLPNWQPQRVVVSLPPSLSKRLPGLEEKLVATAGKVELVIDRSENFILSSDVLAGTDAIIGICTPPHHRQRIRTITVGAQLFGRYGSLRRLVPATASGPRFHQ